MVLCVVYLCDGVVYLLVACVYITICIQVCGYENMRLYVCRLCMDIIMCLSTHVVV